MIRRSFFAAVAATVLALVPCASADPKPARKFHRFDRRRNRWDEIPFTGVRDGDHVWVDDGDRSQVVLASRGYDPADASFMVSHTIDPRTNKWVEVGG